MLRVSRHAAIRFLERVIKTDARDARSIYLAANILQDACDNIVTHRLDLEIPIDGFKGSFMRVRNKVVVTIILK